MRHIAWLGAIVLPSWVGRGRRMLAWSAEAVHTNAHGSGWATPSALTDLSADPVPSAHALGRRKGNASDAASQGRRGAIEARLRDIAAI